MQKSSLHCLFSILLYAEGEQKECPGLLQWGPILHILQLILSQIAWELAGVWTWYHTSATSVVPASKDDDLAAIISLLLFHLLPVWGFQLQTSGTVRTACLMEKVN